jgi:hypothetical protein
MKRCERGIRANKLPTTEVVQSTSASRGFGRNAGRSRPDWSAAQLRDGATVGIVGAAVVAIAQYSIENGR